MVKRYGNLWGKLTSSENIELAYKKAKKKKTSYTAVKKFSKNEKQNLEIIRQSLINKTFKTAHYNEKIVYEPKERIIYVLPFYPDRIVQHALINILEPIFVGMFTKDTYACIKNRGIHKASERTSDYVKNNKYCLKMDIKKFYPSVDQNILYKLIERKIKDKDVLWLIRDIIFSFEGGKNVPIGNLTSQWFGNYYMNELDKLVKHDLKIKDYVRYCDDFCLFSNNKEELNNAKKVITRFLETELELKLSKCDLFPVSRGVDFMGYRHFAKYKLLRKSTAKRVKKRVPKIVEKYNTGRISKDVFRSQIDSTIGWVKWANAYNFMKKTKLLEYRELVNG